MVTDLQAAGWEQPLASGAEAPDVVLLDIGEPYPFVNRAVLNVTAQPATELGTVWWRWRRKWRTSPVRAAPRCR